MKKNAFDSLKKSMQEGIKIAKGKKLEGVKITDVVVNEPKVFTAKSIKKLRASLNVSQPLFAKILGISVNALRNWEQDRQEPSPMARRFLEIIEADPIHFMQQAEEIEIIEQHKSDKKLRA